jgi:predicted flap endonuclease-1-like 5' DNA nuclease
MKFPKFLIGLCIGAIVGLIFWYWQKSTSAEEGALAVLDRLATAELRVRDLEARLRLAEKEKPGEEPPEVLAGLADLWGLDSAARDSRQENQDSSPGLETSNENAEKQAQDDLQAINGIGPAYERRLKEAGVDTYADLAQQTPDQLRQITGLKSWRGADPQQWIDEAQARLQG